MLARKGIQHEEVWLDGAIPRVGFVKRTFAVQHKVVAQSICALLQCFQPTALKGRLWRVQLPSCSCDCTHAQGQLLLHLHVDSRHLTMACQNMGENENLRQIKTLVEQALEQRRVLSRMKVCRPIQA
jgi:hypothetical protein